MEFEYKDNFSLTKLFAKDEDKRVKIFVEDGKEIEIRLKSVRDLFLDDNWMTFYTYATREDKRREFLPQVFYSQNSLEELKVFIFNLGKYKQYKQIVTILREQLESFICDCNINFPKQEILAGDVIITNDIWNYIVYVLKLSCGEKERKPPTFATEADRQLYLAQLEMEARVNGIKEKNNKGGEDDQILKLMLGIIYQFPSLTLDYLFNQTLAQIHWLYGYAMKSVSYDVTSAAFAAGNMKKGAKLQFFTEK